MSKPFIDVIIPAYNEENSIGLVIKDLPKDLIRNIIVCNNNSNDQTRNVALSHGAIVVDQPIPGYGIACLKGLEYIANLATDIKPDIVVFIDGDYSDYPQELPNIIAPILEQGYDLVIGSRALGQRQKGSMTLPQRFGNWLATNLIKLLYGYHFTDLGPFRAVSYNALLKINMKDKDFGWTVEMQVKAAMLKLKCIEVPVNYKKRIGYSKVSGTIKGTIMAGYKILWTIFRLLITKDQAVS